VTRPWSTPVHPTPMAVSSYTSLGEVLRDALVMHKGEDLLIEVNRTKESARFTGWELKQLGERFTARLQALGVGPGDRVAIVMSNQARWLISAYGTFFGGAVLVPLDYKLTPEEQVALIAHAQPKVVVADHGLWLGWEGAVEVPTLLVDAPQEASLGQAMRWEDLPDQAGTYEARSPDDQATLVYSSGTGGEPKGCCLPHRAYLAQLDGLLARFPMKPGDRYFSILPTNHAIDFMVGFVGPFVCGATVVHQRALRPERIRWTMQNYGITHMAVVPLILEAFKRTIDEKLDELPPWKRAVFDGLVQANERLTERRPRHALSAQLLKPIHEGFGGRLRVLFCGGAYTDPELCRFFYRLGLPVVVGYGLTEACTVVSVNRLSPYRADSVGTVLDGVEVRIVDPDEQGVGEVQVRGPTVMDGYFEAPELTEAAFDGEWLKTGDIGYFDAARHLHLVGRRKDLIVTAGGKNIYPQDVEYAFGDVDVEEYAVFSENYLWPKRSMTGERLVLVVRGDVGLRVRDHIASCNRKLSDFKRVCGLLVWDEVFPRTASMKLKRSRLAAQVCEAKDPGQLELL
jgi:long-chain acyl-CoA synthetase